ncbi:c-type cytochrome [Algibacter sp. AS12]|uniref:DUF7133 domain-containing protein n=1 Tax=Algibacter sp. AS12 TaxID=3135773 RepID=UPI00398B6EA9
MENNSNFSIYFNKTSKTFNLEYLLLFTLLFSITACTSKNYEEPKIALDTYHIEKGFALHVAASEPFIEAPVTMDFDNKGRMWVVEMKGYMQNLAGTGDHIPNGTITILEDLDQDGIADHSKIFMDSLVLPRAIAHVYGGLLYAEPPNLWFVDIENDKPVNKVLVDSLYSDGGNVEHQPNGLMMHLDNWIYNAKSNFRYQLKNNQWIKEPTTFRGQWGITKDNFGRLYYNTNSRQLLGDYVLPNTVIKNEYYKPHSLLNKILTPNQRVYPLHPTAVNRGYQKGVLDADSLLINVTSACGPLIYRGDKFPEDYLENAFICAPEANVVKRNNLNFEADKVTAEQAIPIKEFIASTDEGFRPVNLFNGPDGNMYVVDMHRGIIQDKAFLTPYLQKLYAKKQLDTIIGMGRILKVTNTNSKRDSFINVEEQSISNLVALLKHKNGWLRDRAQHLLILKKEPKAISLLKNILKEAASSAVSKLHALYTLDGLNALSYDVLEKVLYSEDSVDVISHAILLMEQFASQDRALSIAKIVKHLNLRNNPTIDLYVLSALGNWMTFSKDQLFPLVQQLSLRYKDQISYQEAFITSLRGHEESYKAFLGETLEAPEHNVIAKILNTTISNKAKNKQNKIFTTKKAQVDNRIAGYNIFRNLCATCHGVEGEGIESLAPPLQNSEYVTESSERLALVILHGLSGPIHVNGDLYDLNIAMPGLANNPEFTDKDIHSIIQYLRNAFPGKTKNISIDKIKSLREQKPIDGLGFTEEELLKVK